MAAAAPLGMAGRFFFGSLCVGTGGLGVWQTQRYFEKRNLIEQRLAELNEAPMDYNSRHHHHQQQQQHIAGAASPSFRRVQVTGHFHHDREMLVGPRSSPGGASAAAAPPGMAVPSTGYFVITPLQLVNNNTKTEESPPTVLLVNRGWIPRNLVPEHSRRRTAGTNASPDPKTYPSSNNNNKSDAKVTDDDDEDDSIRGPGHHQDYPFRHDKHLDHTDSAAAAAAMPWSHPSGVVQVTVVEAAGEVPKYLVPQHTLDTRPAIFFWYDVPTMLKVAGLPLSTSLQSADATENNSKTVSLVTQIDDGEHAIDNNNGKQPKWPLVPTGEGLVQGRVHPAMHIGYAVTWYGLCAAGLVLTRRLATRGR